VQPLGSSQHFMEPEGSIPRVLVFLRSVRRLLVTACVVPSSPIGISSQRTSVASCSLCCS
jgi:hypothetical protein